MSDFITPSQAKAEASDQWKIAEATGILLMVTPTEYKTGVPSPYVKKDGTMLTDVVVAQVVEIDGPNAGTVHDNCWIFQGVLIAQTKGVVGKGRVLGRLVIAPSTKPGFKGAFTLADATPEDVAAAQAYVNAASIA